MVNKKKTTDYLFYTTASTCVEVKAKSPLEAYFKASQELIRLSEKYPDLKEHCGHITRRYKTSRDKIVFDVESKYIEVD